MKTIKRSELYARVWSTPMNRLALELGVSSTRLTEDCRLHSVPTPRAGHWSKIAHGTAGPQPPLPDADDIDIALEGVRPRSSGAPAKARAAAPTVHSARRLLPTMPEPEVAAEPLLTAPSADAHTKTVATVKKLLAGSGPGLRHASGAGCFKVTASAAVIGRAEAFLSALTRSLEAMGGKMADRERGSLAVSLGGETLGFELVEQTDRSPYRLTEADLVRKAKYQAKVVAARRTGAWVSTYDAPKFPDWTHTPNGRLSLKLDDAAGYLGIRKTFSDRKSQRVEDLIDTILEALVAYVAAVEARKIETARRRQEAEAAEREQRRQQKRQELEARRVEFLNLQLARLDSAHRIDGLLARLEEPLADEGVARFRAWAVERRDGLRAEVLPEILARKIAATDLMNDKAVIESWIDVETGRYGRSN